MKLLRYGPVGAEKPGILDSRGHLRDLSAHVDDIAGVVLTPEGLDHLRSINPESLPVVTGSPRIGACVGRIGKFICVGLNYADHAAESGLAVPPEPVLFMKATSAVCGPNDDVIIPKGSLKTDWEVELGVVIGREARYVDEAQAMAHVAGYSIVMDGSVRDYQKHSVTAGKNFDASSAFGPWMVTADEIPEPKKMVLTTRLNGEVMQHSGFDLMAWDLAELVSYISDICTLLPGDVIATGTPGGVGHRRDPQIFMKAGDVLEIEVSGIGILRNRVVDEAAL
jgi:2-keto-4-pentenoate hydratase/2-oxohepta-3-ene-1,7-dioic acid hydratase in catechol pathway